MSNPPIPILFNPSAGRGRAQAQRRHLEHLLERRGVRYTLRISRSADHLRELLRTEAEQAPIVAAVGGDSTFTIVLNEMMALANRPALAMIGLGSCNDLLREFSLERLDDAVAALARKRPQPVDIACMEGPGLAPVYFLGQASIGLGTEVNADIADQVRRGAWSGHWMGLAGFLAVRRACRRGKVPLEITVTAPGFTHRGRVMLAVFSNIRHYAGGLPLVPAARPDDGILDVVLVEECSLLRLAGLFQRVKAGRHTSHPLLTAARASGFTLTSPVPFAVQIDGEIIGGAASPAMVREVFIRTLPAALHLLR